MIRESYTETIENELVNATLKGDKSAFEAIVRNYQGIVARTVKGML